MLIEAYGTPEEKGKMPIIVNTDYITEYIYDPANNRYKVYMLNDKYGANTWFVDAEIVARLVKVSANKENLHPCEVAPFFYPGYK